MILYVRGYVKHIIQEQKTLTIELANCTHGCNKCNNKTRCENIGQPLTQKVLNAAIDIFKRQIDVICFVGGEEEQQELIHLCEDVHKHGFKTAMSTAYYDVSMLNKKLVDELDYVLLGRCDETRTILKKDYCPFADATDWIEIKNTNIRA